MENPSNWRSRRAAEGRHDDRVLTLAIGVHLLPMATRYEIRTGPSVLPYDMRDEDDYGGGEWS